MGRRYVQSASDLTIASSGSTSNAISDIASAISIVIYGPASLDQTINVEVAQDATSGATFYPLLSAGSNVTITAAKATVITAGGFKQLRVKTASGTETAERVFLVDYQVEV